MDQGLLELNILSYLLEGEESLYKAREQGVNIKSFAIHKVAYEFVCDHLHNYGHLPTRETVTKVLSIPLSAAVDVPFCLDLLLKRELKRHMENVLTEGITMLAED